MVETSDEGADDSAEGGKGEEKANEWKGRGKGERVERRFYVLER